MVENTVGRLWLDLHPDSPHRTAMRYLIDNPDAKAEPIITEVAEIKLLDPACGLGHILVEGFDRLFAMCREEFYTAREAVDAIFKHNLFGLDIDLRAAQLAQFALLLKAAQQDRTVIERNITPQVYAMPDAAIFTEQEVADFLGRAGKDYIEDLSQALELMRQSQNLGSIMKFCLSEEARSAVVSRYDFWLQNKTADWLEQELWQHIRLYIEVLLVLTRKYEAVVANPPYMGSGNMNEGLKKYINDKYPQSKADLFSVFMEVGMQFCQTRGFMGMINMHSWMFLSSFETLRKCFIEHYQFENMLHLGTRTFDELSGEVVQNTTFIFRNYVPQYNGVYFRLVDGANCTAKENMFLNGENRFEHISQGNFEKMPGSPIAYWVSEKMMNLLATTNIIGAQYETGSGLSTSDNVKYLRYIWEVANSKISNNEPNSDKKWYLWLNLFFRRYGDQ
jgi:hypothetical protein